MFLGEKSLNSDDIILYILEIKESNHFYTPLCTPVAGSANPRYMYVYWY
jgi:hypothetical protein